MLRFTVKRFFGAIPTLLVLMVLAFALIRVAPGG
ncbi:MAG: ABC-type dipeptide/oligopeptide/nickel transport system permease component, partial [Gammaproteobacteria bacterium]